MSGDRVPDAGAAVPILLYLPAFNGGGAENALVRLANYWHAAGRTVGIVVNKAEGPVLARVASGIEIVDLGTLGTVRPLVRLRRWLAERRPPLLVTALLRPNVLGPLAARAVSPGTVVVSLLRNHLSAEIADRSLPARLVLPRLLRPALRRVAAVGCVAEDVAADVIAFAGLSPDRVRTTLNPVPFPPAGAAAAPRPADMPAADLPVLVAVGRLSSQKDYPTMLRAVARLDRPVRLVVLGEGPLRDEIAALATDLGIGDRVHLLGFRDRPEDYIRHADLFVLTSRFEGFPNVVAEALALGRTAVATAAPGGSANILGDGAYGYLAPPGDAGAIADQIARALDAPLPAERLLARAGEFAIEAVAARYDALFAHAIALGMPGRPRPDASERAS